MAIPYTGTLTRNGGTLTAGEDSIELTCSPGNGGVLRLLGLTPNTHWRGEINATRTEWHLVCKFGFLIRGTCTWTRTGYQLVQTHYSVPTYLRLQDEAAEVAVA